MFSVRPVALLACLALAVPALPAQELPSSLGAVQGTLLAADNKQPVLDASVWLESAASATPPAHDSTPDDTDYNTLSSPDPAHQAAVKTDPAGRFLIPKVKPGDYYVLFSAQGYIGDRDFVPPAGALSTTKPLPDFVQKVTVTPGKTADLTLSLQHGGAIEGNIHYANGQPGYQEAAGQTPAGLPVSLGVRRGNGTFARALAPTRTDAQGHFRFTDVPPGAYLVFVPLPSTPSGTAAPTTSAPARRSVVFYGDTPNPSRAKLATVQGTQTTSAVEITLPSPAAKP